MKVKKIVLGILDKVVTVLNIMAIFDFIVMGAGASPDVPLRTTMFWIAIGFIQLSIGGFYFSKRKHTRRKKYIKYSDLENDIYKY